MRALQRAIALCLLAALGALLFYIGREHQIFLDNKTVEVEGKSYKALKLVKIGAEGKDPVELMPRDRDLFKLVGPSFALKVEIMDEYGEKVEKTIDLKLSPGFGKDMMISVPLLAAGHDGYILPPPTGQTPPPEETPPAPAEGLPAPSGEAPSTTNP